LTQVVVGPREDDLDLAEETPDDLSEAHGREGSRRGLRDARRSGNKMR
jgi:hypothetical protein